MLVVPFVLGRAAGVGRHPNDARESAVSGGKRPARVSELIQRALSSRLIPELRDPRLGFATVTGVELSNDLRSARVYVTIYERDDTKRVDAIEALNRAAGHLRRDLGRQLRLRIVPTLLFVEDESIARADRIEQILRGLGREEGEARGDGPPEGDEAE